MMQAKRLLGVVVGSTDPGHHQRSLDQGEEAARIIEEYGNNATVCVSTLFCFLFVSLF